MIPAVMEITSDSPMSRKSFIVESGAWVMSDVKGCGILFCCEVKYA